MADKFNGGMGTLSAVFTGEGTPLSLIQASYFPQGMLSRRAQVSLHCRIKSIFLYT